MKKFYYKNNTQRSYCMASLKELAQMYREDGYIDGDSMANIFYKDGTALRYPDDADKIKIKNIQNVYILTPYDSMDFKHDFIGTQEDFDFEKWLGTKNPNLTPDYKNPLIVDDMDNYYKQQEAI